MDHRDSDPTSLLTRTRQVLDYAPPAQRRPPSWLTRPINPELGLLIWAWSSIALGTTEPDRGGLLFAIGYVWYAWARSSRWKAHWVWRGIRFIGLLAFGYSAFRFIAPWAAEGFSMKYWLIYNVTYGRNYDASLRWKWHVVASLGAIALSVVGDRLTRPTPDRCRAGSTACPPPPESK